MPLGLIVRLQLHCRPAVMIAAGLIAVQAVLAGLGLAQAALILTPGLADFAVICHGNGGSDSPASAPDPAHDRHPCCESCTAAAPPAMLPEQAIVLRTDRRGIFKSPIVRAASIPVTRRAVRAGPSQAPPSHA